MEKQLGDIEGFGQEMTRRQVSCPAEGTLAYATVVAGAASLQKPSGLHKSTANGSDPAEPA
jgi:hypothetical protein